MHYHVILTKECNLLCGYCGGGSESPPKEIEYPLSALQRFLSLDDSPVVAFYGGEPLLRIGTMEKIMDSVEAKFVVQTNGLLLDRVPAEYLNRFHSILVSVDGTKEVTEMERGRGVYDHVMRNVELVRREGFRGDLVARMTVSQGADIVENVRHLLATGVFDHVHWQLSFSMFWEAGEQTEPGLPEWLGTYNEGISSLVEFWLREMERSGRVLGLPPFLAVMNTLLTGRRAQLRCGSGVDFFSIMPNGRISACPVSVDFDFSVLGSMSSETPSSLRGKIGLGEPCTSCDILAVCGGRCLFVNHSQQLLRRGGYASICSTVRHLVMELDRARPIVQAFIDERRVKRSDFEYPELNDGCEIIP